MGKYKRTDINYSLFKAFSLIVLLTAFYMLSFVPQSQAQTPRLVLPTDSEARLSGCAVDTWTAMVNQAVLESRRKTAFDKRFIVKSDSVLQYSCFGELMQSTLANIDPLFTASDYWANRSVDILGDDVTIEIYNQDSSTEPAYNIDFLSRNSLEEALVLVVDGAFQNYINGQFNHPYLSGTIPLGASVSIPAGGTGLEPCANMAQIWSAAMCKNLDATTVFPTFEEMAGGYEPRQFPPGANWECN